MSFTINPGGWSEPVIRMRLQVVQCPDCGGWRMDLGGVHSPTLHEGRRIDCVGREVEPKALEAVA